MSFTPYNAPLLAPLLGDREVAGCFSVASDIAAMVSFEAALAKAQADIGMISGTARDEIIQVLGDIEVDIKMLAMGAARDGLVVPAFVRQVRDALSDENKAAFHKGTTSQDLIDTSVMVRLRDVVLILRKRLAICLDALSALQQAHGQNTLMGYTRMQAALPISAEDRLSAWRQPLEKSLSALESVAFPIQLGGPVGTADAFDGNRDVLARIMAAEIGLADPGHCWHTDRTPTVAIGQAMTTLCGALGKMGQDVVLMAQMGDEHITLSGGGGSSAMAHKNNPVAAEALVTLAHFTSTQMVGLNMALVHEQERSGAAWVLEWMIMPQIAVACGAALNNAASVLDKIERIGHPHASNGKPT